MIILRNHFQNLALVYSRYSVDKKMDQSTKPCNVRGKLVGSLFEHSKTLSPYRLKTYGVSK